MTIIIRPAKIDELPVLSRLCLRSKAVWGYDQAFLDACRSELTLRPDDLTSSRVAVAQTHGAVAGVVQVKVVATDADLLKLFIEPDRLRSGAGSALFRWAIEQARALGATRMIIEADPDAAAFYRHLGAYDIGSAPSGSIPGRFLPQLALDLNAPHLSISGDVDPGQADPNSQADPN